MAGMTRKIDDLGRVSIPKEARKNLGWFSGDEIEIIFDGKQVILRKFTPNYQDELLHVKEIFYNNPEVEHSEEIIAALDTALSYLQN